MKAWFVVLTVVAVALSGCGGKDSAPAVDPTQKDPSQLEKGKGAIAGLLLDDRARPIADATLLLEQNGQTTKSNADGEFYFIDLEPGTYRLRAQVPGHEANPINVKVEEGAYSEQRVFARRIVDETGSIITREFSVFIPCAVNVIVNSYTVNCVVDLSGDSFRSSFTVNTSDVQDITYLVTEMKANSVGEYAVQVREDDGTSGGGARYAVAYFEGDYIKMVNRLGEVNEEHNDQANNVAWTNDREYSTNLFVFGEYRQETSVDPALCCGVGAQFGIEATFVQSIFIGEPEVDVSTYQVLGS